MSTSKTTLPALSLAAMMAMLLPTGATAEDLLQVYQQARQADPALARAEAQDLSAQEGVAQARAQLLPQLSASYSYNRSHSNSYSATPEQQADGSFQTFATRSGADSYGTSLRADLSQTLVDFSAYANLDANQASAAAQDELFRAAQQDLMVRVARAYFGVLTADDQLSFAKAREAALAKQLDQAQQRYDVGLSAITDVNEAKANHDAAVADVINASNAVDNAREALVQITGQDFGTLEPLREDLPMDPPSPNDQQAWVDRALEQSPEVLAQRHQVAAAEESIDAARAARLPSLGASLSYSRAPGWSDSESAALANSLHSNSNRESSAIGLTLSVPLFNGGAIRSRVRQSIYQRDAATATLEQDRRQTISDTRSAFRSVVAGISEVEARKQAVLSAQSALDATQAGYEVGTRNIIDVLNVQQQLFQARSAHSQARHDFIVNKLLLERAAGTLDHEDLAAVNALLTTPTP